MKITTNIFLFLFFCGNAAAQMDTILWRVTRGPMTSFEHEIIRNTELLNVGDTLRISRKILDSFVQKWDGNKSYAEINNCTVFLTERKTITFENRHSTWQYVE